MSNRQMSSRKLFRVTGTFASTFLSYFLISMVIILLVLPILYSRTVRTIERQSVESYEVALLHTHQASQVVLDQISLAIAQLVTNSAVADYLDFYRARDYVMVRRVQETLTGFLALNRQIESITLVFAQDGAYYSPRQGVRDLHEYEDQQILETIVAADLGPQHLLYRRIPGPVAGEPQQVLTFVRRVPLTHFSPQVFLLVDLNTEFFTDISRALAASPQPDIVVLLNDQPISWTGASDERILAAIAKATADTSPPERITTSRTVSIEGSEQLVVVSSEDHYGIRYAAVKEISSILREVLFFRTFLLILGGATVLVAVGSAYALSRLIFGPIRALALRVHQGEKADQPKVSVEAIEAGVGRLIEEQQELARELELREPAIRNSLLHRLLFYGVKEAQRPHGVEPQALARYDLASGRGPFVIGYMVVDPDPPRAELEPESRYAALLIVQRRLFQTLSPIGGCWFVELSSRELGVVCATAASEQEVSDRTYTAVRAIARDEGSEVHVGFGPVAQSLDTIAASFQAARREVTPYNILNPQQVSWSSEHSVQAAAWHYPRELEAELVPALLSADRDRTSTVLRSIFDSLMMSESRGFRLATVQLFAALSRAASEAGSELSQLFPDRDLLEEVLSEPTRERTYRRFEEYAIGIQTHIDERKERRNEDLVDRVKELIRGNLDQELSLTWLSDRIYLSEAYLSHLFKSTSGEALKRYISRKRVERARELLEDERLDIWEVGEKVGYDRAQSFIKLFKNETGITPGEYRRRLALGSGSQPSRN